MRKLLIVLTISLFFGNFVGAVYIEQWGYELEGSWGAVFNGVNIVTVNNYYIPSGDTIKFYFLMKVV